jgi:hypothetical protein
MLSTSVPNPRRVVISQPMYFPWVGMLEQIQLADIFVFYNDVQFSRGFFHRVQIKTARGTPWITIPLRHYHRGQLISAVAIDDRQDWQQKHRAMLAAAYQQAQYRDEMLSLVDRVFAMQFSNVAELARASMIELANYFGLLPNRRFVDSQSLPPEGKSSQRLCDIARTLGGDVYVTGHGARNYLDHDLFERNGIAVEYMRYECRLYPQLHGPFTPYVSALDLVANCGPQGARYIVSGTQSAREFVETA